jgi:hypothetical protein
MDSKTTISLIPVAFLTVILFSSVLASEDANAGLDRYKKGGGGGDHSVQSLSQACFSQYGNCQNLGLQQRGYRNSANAIGIQRGTSVVNEKI